jgi:hypothetical protein
VRKVLTHTGTIRWWIGRSNTPGIGSVVSS